MPIGVDPWERDATRTSNSSRSSNASFGNIDDAMALGAFAKS